MEPIRIIGIDPGIARLGYGIVDVAGSTVRCVTYGCVETPAHTPLTMRLKMIHDELTMLMESHRPMVMAIEELFFNRNTTTAFTVAQARGVALLSAAMQDIAVAEYTPMQVKQAVTGYGRADKQQIQQMVKILLNLAQLPKPDDAADALAIAIAHGHSAPMKQFEAKDTVRTGWNWERRTR